MLSGSMGEIIYFSYRLYAPIKKMFYKVLNGKALNAFEK